MKILFLFLINCSLALGQFTLPSVIYGYVSDGSGTIIDDPSTSIVIYRNGTEEVGRATLEKKATENYRIQIPDPSGLAEYTAKFEGLGGESHLFLLSPGSVPFSLVTEESKRLEFMKGEDSDLDGLPDDWEEFQLGYINILPGDPGYSLNLLSPNGDYDFDGLTNHEEFIARTIATSLDSRVNFKLLEKKNDGRIEAAFDAVAGRTYELQISTDFDDWDPLQISMEGEFLTTFRATATARLTILLPANSAEGVFYRMSVE